MKRFIGVVVVLAVALAGFAVANEAEFSWYKVGGPGPYHVDLVSGHGKTCYVFSEEVSASNAGHQPVLLWIGNPAGGPFLCSKSETGN